MGGAIEQNKADSKSPINILKYCCEFMLLFAETYDREIALVTYICTYHIHDIIQNI